MGKFPMTPKSRCPHCGLNLVSYDAFAGYVFKEIGVRIAEASKDVLYYECPACGGTWQRWDATNPLYAKADPYMRGSQR